MFSSVIPELQSLDYIWIMKYVHDFFFFFFCTCVFQGKRDAGEVKPFGWDAP